ncbi:hypothetical protein [Pedobacter nototheniae]|uniref:hypothetical protein n=1 Tax=Pedobacter nototheniae TaxID=2488994 RepID=UPI002930A6F1|nr:hypothetical protein [Pedobacter nototheniae]
MNTPTLTELKFKLQTLGALQPEAWDLILKTVKYTFIKTGENFNRQEGQLAWILTGLLKEYDAEARKKPSVINFILPGHSLITRKLNKHFYLKAYTDTYVVHLEFEELIAVYGQFKELRTTYDSLCANYDEGMVYRQRILEEKSAQRKVELFLIRYRPYLVVIQKKDISNYLKLNYDYFTSIYTKLL